ncbi:MAG TPA: condensation domain-containing protein, partial [Thermoanaerobaculia bacterium]
MSRGSDFSRLSLDKQRSVLALLQKKSAGRQSIRPSPRRQSGEPFPLSFSQQRLWFLDQIDPDNLAYNLTNSLRLSGRLEVASLRRAFSEIVRRHESLRTVFELFEGEPVQRVLPASDERFQLPELDLSALPDAVRERELVRLVALTSALPFDVQRGPHLRVFLVRLTAQEHALLIAMHHIASDGWSVGLVVRETTQLYSEFVEGRPSPLPPLELQYADWSDWQREHLSGAVLEEQLQFWKERLATAPPLLPLATDRPRPPVQTSRGDVVPFV